MANRLWQHHFGYGIVRTPSNFGRLGQPPTHPELLEYLTDRFIASGYSMKALHREILLSATYQLSSSHSAENHRKDPENRLLWKANRRRLDAEVLRDSILFVSGRLDFTLGGPSVDLGADQQRRTLYGRIQRSQLDGFLALFDFPDPGLTSQQRLVTNVPSQRLFFLNSDLVWNQAGFLAKRLIEGRTKADSRTVEKAYRFLYSRLPSNREERLALDFLADDGAGIEDKLTQYLQVLISSNEFLFVD